VQVFIAEGSLIGSGCGKAAFKHRLRQWEMEPFFVEKIVRATPNRLTIQQIRWMHPIASPTLPLHNTDPEAFLHLFPAPYPDRPLWITCGNPLDISEQSSHLLCSFY
jgi:hypothetical protein